MRLRVLAIAALLSSATVAAADASLTTATGDRYRVQQNAHGAVLHGKGGPIYLGRACDASSKRAGNGRWQWANGGVVVELGNQRLAFPRQELDIDGADGCRA